MERPTSQFLRQLEAAMIAELREDLGTALRVGVLLALGLSSREACERLSLYPTDFKRAKALVDRAAARMRDAGSS